jgi:hypothetical protein
MIVLAGFDWSEVVRSIAWDDGDGVMLRVLADDRRSWFNRRSTSASLAAEFGLTSSLLLHASDSRSVARGGVLATWKRHPCARPLPHPSIMGVAIPQLSGATFPGYRGRFPGYRRKCLRDVSC